MSAAVEADTRSPERVPAAPTDPHWIVVSLARGIDAPYHLKPRWRLLYRHPTEDSANAECQRLACKLPGTRFAVYAAGFSCKIERPSELPA